MQGCVSRPSQVNPSLSVEHNTETRHCWEVWPLAPQSSMWTEESFSKVWHTVWPCHRRFLTESTKSQYSVFSRPSRSGISVSCYEESQNEPNFSRNKYVAVVMALLTTKTTVVLVHRCIPVILVWYQANTATVMLIIMIPVNSSLLKFRIRLTMEGRYWICTGHRSIVY